MNSGMAIGGEVQAMPQKPAAVRRFALRTRRWWVAVDSGMNIPQEFARPSPRRNASVINVVRRYGIQRSRSPMHTRITMRIRVDHGVAGLTRTLTMIAVAEPAACCRSHTNTRFRPGTTGACEAQLWIFTCPPGFLADDSATEVHGVAAESLDAALEYLRRWHHDFIVTEARCLGMIPLLSGSPLD